MERKPHSRPAIGRRQRGSITLVSLCLTTALGIALASYLALTNRSAQLSKRMATLDRASQLAQAGLEEALWALNQNNWVSSGPEGSTSWTIVGANRTTTLSYALSGPGTGSVAVTIANYASTGPVFPTITSQGTVNLPGGDLIAKTLQATVSPAPLFGNAIASAESYVSFIDRGTVDSWNSDPDNNPATAAVNYSFNATNPANYAAVVSGRGNGTYGVILTQATVRGYISTFGLPVSYSTSGSPGASILGPNTPAGVNVDLARIGKSAFVPMSDMFPVSLPPTTGGLFAGIVATIDELTNGILHGGGGAEVYRIPGSIAVLLPLNISRPIKLIIEGDLTIGGLPLLGGPGRIRVSAGGSLEIYVLGDVTIQGLGFDNDTNDPRKLAIFCTGTTSNTPLLYNTPESFCGVIFCENRPIDIKQNATFYGALLSRQYVRFSGSATAPVFHYDAALRNARFTGVTTPYIVKKVTEL